MGIMKFLLASAGIIILVAGCVIVPPEGKGMYPEGERLTVGTVQRKISVGMSGAQVIKALGSPNIVTTDEQRREVWTYDRISTERVYTQHTGYLTLILVGSAGRAGRSATSQQTLTIIIKFDEEGKVRDFAYHASRF